MPHRSSTSERIGPRLLTTLPLGITPRCLTREQAAEYCACETVDAFDDWIRRGIVPEAMPGTTRWDRRAIDRALDRRSGLTDDAASTFERAASHAEQDRVERTARANRLDGTPAEPREADRQDSGRSGAYPQREAPTGPATPARGSLANHTDPARHVVRLLDVARELGLSPTTLRKLCRDGKGPPLLQLSERWYGVRRGDLDAWIEGQRFRQGE